MANKYEFKPFSWFCPNCGHKVAGFRNEKGDIKLTCGVCKVSMIRTLKTPRRSTIEVIAPNNCDLHLDN